MADRQRPLRPRGGAPAGRRKRRVVIDSQAARPRPDARTAREPSKPRAEQPAPAQPTGPVSVNSGATVKELSAALGVPVPQIIKIMMDVGEMVTITQSLGDDAIELIATQLERQVEIKHADEEELEPEVYEDAPDDLTARPPVVTIMGHVDHGKTTLLDAIRSSAVVETEAGGITQHIGAYQFADVSAKNGQGLDDLLEKILLVADAELELSANAKAEASGPIIESRLDVGRGPVATMLVLRGTLHVGDAIVAGDAWGKVRALHDFRGEKLKGAGPGTPVEILGFDKPPGAGEQARVVENERQARHLAGLRGQRLRAEQLARSAKKGVSLEELFTRMEEGGLQELNIIVKGDVQGSVEAVVGELAKIKHPEVAVNVIHTGIGAITESDVMLASASNAIVAGFNVRPNADARALAEREGVDIRTYRVIYQLTDDIQQALVGMLSPVQTEETLGEAEVRALFRVSRLGTIAGCMVTTGLVRRGARVRVVRDGTVIHETSIAQLKRFKDDAREVAEGFECGILLDGFNNVKEGDVLEVFETREVERTDLDEAPPAAPPP